MIAGINLVIAQRLIRCLCPHCKEKIKIPKEIIPYAKKALKQFPEYKQPEYIFQAKGCAQCSFTGYQGQIGIFETLIPPTQTKDLAQVDFPKLIDDGTI